MRFAADGVWRATRTPQGPATVHLRAVGDHVVAEAWGKGTDWALAGVPELIGAGDDDAGFVAHDPLVAELRHRIPGLRLPRSAAVVEALVPSILEQKVTGIEARRSFGRLVRAYGEPAPGPADLWLPPNPARLAAIPYYDLHRLGVERRRADTIRRAAGRAAGLDALAGGDPVIAARRLTAIPGIGAWTAAEVTRVALGDPDAVSVGDYHLPHQVSWAFTGEPRGSDERMLDLLEPYRGHRGRVTRLIEVAGIGPPRRAPRRAIRSIAGW